MTLQELNDKVLESYQSLNKEILEMKRALTKELVNNLNISFVRLFQMQFSEMVEFLKQEDINFSVSEEEIAINGLSVPYIFVYNKGKFVELKVPNMLQLNCLVGNTLRSDLKFD